MPASESTEARPSEPMVTSADPSSVSMSDLLASCAAASAVSTPPTSTPTEIPTGVPTAVRDDSGDEAAA